MPTDPKDPASSPSDTLFGGAQNTGFNYDAFQQRVDEEQEDQVTDHSAVEAQVQSRPTIDLRRLPQDDATFDIRELAGFKIVTIRGRINESFDGDTLGNRLKGNVMFDLTEVDRITSFGVRAWLQMLDAAKIKSAMFVRASPAVINQVTMMRNFCGPAKIHSLVAPYSCGNCGHEFGVTYEGVADREALTARSPHLVECPQCRSAAEFDEDPWVFFGIDEQLIESITPDQQRVIDNLGDRPAHAPIEKSLRGDVTSVRFNGVVDENTRFKRAFSDLEGRVSVDLRTATEVAPGGIDALYGRLTSLDSAISEIELQGCPIPLLERLLDDGPQNVKILSAQTEARDPAKKLSASVTVDLVRHAKTLTSGRVPILDIPWQDSSTQLVGLELLRKAAGSDQTAKPAPIASAPGTSRRIPIVPIAIGLVILAALAGTAIYVAVSTSIEDPQPQPSATPAAAAPAPDTNWSTGGALPPTWVETPMVNNGDHVLLAAVGTGPTSTGALANGRKEALVRALDVAAKRANVTLPTGTDLDRAREFWVSATSALPLQRTESASRTNDDGTFEAALQYKLNTADLDALVAPSKQTVESVGLTVRQSYPWELPGVMVTNRKSYRAAAQPGDRVASVGQIAVTDLATFRTFVTDAYRTLAPGASLPLVLKRGDEAIPLPIVKPSRQAAPTPTADIPTLQGAGQ